MIQSGILPSTESMTLYLQSDLDAFTLCNNQAVCHCSSHTTPLLQFLQSQNAFRHVYHNACCMSYLLIYNLLQQHAIVLLEHNEQVFLRRSNTCHRAISQCQTVCDIVAE